MEDMIIVRVNVSSCSKFEKVQEILFDIVMSSCDVLAKAIATNYLFYKKVCSSPSNLVVVKISASNADCTLTSLGLFLPASVIFLSSSMLFWA